MRYKLAALVIALQIVFFIGWAAWEEGVFDGAPPRIIRVQTVPVDPRDYLSGQYMTLGYAFSQTGSWDTTMRKWENAVFLQAVQPLKPGSSLWVVLRPENGFYVPDRAAYQKPETLAAEEVAIRGSVGRFNRIEYGVEKYFITEGTKTPDSKDVTVELKVNARGTARIHRVFVKDRVWP